MAGWHPEIICASAVMAIATALRHLRRGNNRKLRDEKLRDMQAPGSPTASLPLPACECQAGPESLSGDVVKEVSG